MNEVPEWARALKQAHALPSGSTASRAQLEDEAQRFGREWPETAVLPPSRPAFAASAAEARLANAAINSETTELPPSLRDELEQSLGGRLAPLRVHTGPEAEAVARAVGARAWSFGSDIGFAAGAFEPYTPVGQRLIAHEAAHAMQQRGASPALLTDEATGVQFHFSVRVERELDSDELLIAFIQQYSRLPSREDAEAARIAGNWRWVGEPQVADEEAVRRGYVLILVRDRSLSRPSAAERARLRETVSGLSPGERAALNAEVDRRFWEATQYRPGTQLGTSSDDQRMAEYWLAVRDHLVGARHALTALPEHVRALLFDPSAARRLAPSDYETALRVGQKLAAMSAAELADWRARITGATEDWAHFEASLDAYLAEEAERRREQLELGRLQARIYGLEALYSLREQLKAQGRVARLPSRDEFGIADPTVIEARARLPDLERQFGAALRENGFENEAEFDAALAAWRAAFERETRRVADVMLDRLDHVLFEQERRYTSASQARSLSGRVARSGAPGHFTRAREEAQRSIRLSAPRNAMSGACHRRTRGDGRSLRVRGRCARRRSVDAEPRGRGSAAFFP